MGNIEAMILKILIVVLFSPLVVSVFPIGFIVIVGGVMWVEYKHQEFEKNRHNKKDKE